MGSATVDGPPVGWQRSGRRATPRAQPEPDVDEGRPAPRRRLGPSGLAACAVVTVALAALAVYQGNSGNSWRPPFFFDEMWRVDFIRAGNPIDRMLTHDTPVPLGWIGLMHGITAPLPYHPIVFRVISAVWFLLGAGVLSVLFVRLLQRTPSNPERFRLRERPLPTPILAAPIGVALAMFIPLVTIYVQWFNNYTFEILYVALLVLAAEELDRTPRYALPAFCGLLALAPLFVIGGLFAVPGLVLCAGWWAWRSDDGRRRQRLAALAGACGVAAVAGAVIWIKVYKPVSAKPSIANYWIDFGSSLGGPQGVVDLLTKTHLQLISGLIGDRLYFADGWMRWTGYTVLAVSVVVGVTVVARRWAWLLLVVGLAWILSILASAAIHWPMTIERVNLCWQILFYATVGVGLARSVLWCTGKLWGIGIGVLALVFVVLWFPPYDVGINAFDRNLTYDLQQVADSPAPHNLVLQYNQLAQFYAHDALVNTGHDGRTFDVRWEGQLDPDPLLQPIDPVIAQAGLATGDMVWCVIPGEVGEKAAHDCRITDPSRLELVTKTDGLDATVIGYRVR